MMYDVGKHYTNNLRNIEIQYVCGMLLTKKNRDSTGFLKAREQGK